MKKMMIWLVIGGVMIIQAVAGWVIILSLPKWADRAAFGDMFGLTTSLFSGLALAGVVYAILLQRAELSLQRKEIQLTRTELERSATAQQNSYEMLRKQLDFSRKVHKAELRRTRAETLPHFQIHSCPYTAQLGITNLTLLNGGARIRDLSIDTDPLRIEEVIARQLMGSPKYTIAFNGQTGLIRNQGEIKFDVTFTPAPASAPPFSFNLGFLDIHGNRRRVRIDYQPPLGLTTTEVEVPVSATS